MPQVTPHAHLLPENMLLQLPEFMAKIQTLSELIGIELADYQADHIAIRVNDPEAARFAHKEWLKWGNEISCAHINGRPIIVLAFTQPLMANGWSFECLELPYPAAGKRYPVESWEHVEFVIPSQAETAADYLAFLTSTFPNFQEKSAEFEEIGIKVKVSCPKGEGERLPNPTVAFQHKGVCIKLHPHSLKRVIASEQG
ncbi:VOC family protein [Vibrio sp. S9_S30]|uniref:VOC family protein n=1 Tax=Vibrio sp. S9_S30 TaxID=2720226 RepID=UPI001680C72F|nr:VOC family protein [Vibrio sp. S9_S30]MBD1559092.1 VOC family protein [Vibrio sp. S9_S30]